MLILKPRQKGCSTFSTAMFYNHLSFKRANGCIIGGAHKQGDNLFKMMRLYSDHDGIADKGDCKVLDAEARWVNGSRAVQETANNPEAGRSGTYQFLIGTEVARWAEEGVSNAGDVLAGILKCVPFMPDTVAILETTARGASGDFYDRWQDGLTFEEFEAGKEGFIKVFAPWFMFEDSKRDPASEDIHATADYTVKESELAAKWKLSMKQVAWMRWAIREECKRDFDTFCQDYPFDDESAFLSSGRKRFNVAGIKLLKDAITSNPPEYGILERQREQLNFRHTPKDDALVHIWERPKRGLHYLLAVDPMTGSSQVSGKDPDNHGVVVLRKGYFESGRGWRKPKVVARLPKSQWDIDVLESEVAKLSEHYGNCLIVPEMNMDRGLVELLKLRGANIYQREIFNRRDFKTTTALGWMTTTETRGMIIEGLAKAIREWDVDASGLDCACPDIISELESFIVKDTGRAEAMKGKHDDQVLALAIGLACLDSATAYSPPELVRTLPRDLQNLEASRVKRSGQYS
jgi:hypothetical protein